MTSVFLTGATGYVGGQVLRELSRNHPNLAITALVRDSHKAKLIADLNPAIKTVIGSLDDVQLIESQAAQASIVLNVGSNKHMAGAQAIHRGLLSRRESSPSYWIQMSGASALAAGDLASPSYDVGLPSSTVYDDLDGIEAIRSLIRAHPTTRVMDNYVLDVAANSSSGSTPQIKTALILGPIIYGRGEGPGNQRSIQIPSLSRLVLEGKQVVRAGQGLNRWANVHVSDIARVFTALAQAGADGKKDDDDDGLWGGNGIYLPTSGHEMSFGEISDAVGHVATEKGWISDSQVKELSKSESDKLLPGGSVFFGSNARGKSRRANALLGWEPRGPGLDQEIPRAVEEEARSLSLS